MSEQAARTPLQCVPDAGFVQWLSASGGSLAISTYQAGFLFMVGWNGRQVSFLPRSFQTPTGLDVQARRLALATRGGISLFADAPELAYEYREPGRYDALYLPRATYHLPELSVHDLAFGDEGLWWVNTRMSCLSLLSRDYSVEPRWTPRFISDLAPEDRCHLNGLALKDGKPFAVTALGTGDTLASWRDTRRDGGVVIDVGSGEIVLRGLAMPHSPRSYRDALWVLNSGAGQLLRLDASGKSEVVCELPGYLRGLCFAHDYALVGLCQIRESNIFGGMPVQEKYPQLQCAIAVISLRSGLCVGMLRFVSGCTEIYDLRFLPGVQRPNVLNLDKPDIRRAVHAPAASFWLAEESPASPAAS
ncbi:MAG: hypothetical protein JWR16_1791 [Nevskia sp.]|nr:hypothetical protein [Nevskia sp.]